MIVKLTWPEVNAACQVALFRQVSNYSRGIPRGTGADESFFGGLSHHTQACLAEIAVAKAFNLYWSGVAGIREPDVGFQVEVRSVDSRNKRLILHNKDVDAPPYVLAYVDEDPTTVELLGWIRGYDGKKPEYIADPVGGRSAYFVPRPVMRKMNELDINILPMRAT